MNGPPPKPTRTPRRTRRKWRPGLGLVVFSVLLTVAMLPLAGFLLIIGFEKVSGIEFQLRSLNGFLALAAGSVMATLVIGYVFLRTLLSPLRELIQRTEEIENGSKDAFRPLERAGSAEMATLSQRFFSLARKLSDRSAYLQLFTSHVTHELKSPITAIQGAAELLRDQGRHMSEEENAKFLGNIVEDAGQMALLCNRLRELARAEIARTDGSCLLDGVIERAVDGAGLREQIKGDKGAVIAMSEENAAIVFRQLALNAREQDAGQFYVAVKKLENTVLIGIGDDGMPISEGNRDKIFEPFFTTRRTDGGTGMGLQIVRAMLENHGGSIKLAKPGAGLKFEMRVPRG